MFSVPVLPQVQTPQIDQREHGYDDQNAVEKNEKAVMPVYSNAAFTVRLDSAQRQDLCQILPAEAENEIQQTALQRQQ